MAAEFLVLGWTTLGENHLDLSVFEISSQGVTKRKRLESRWGFNSNAEVYSDPKLENIWVHYKDTLYCVRCNGKTQKAADFQYNEHIEGYSINFEYILVGSDSLGGFCKMIQEHNHNVHTVRFDEAGYHYEGFEELTDILDDKGTSDHHLGYGAKSGYQNPEKEYIPIADIGTTHFLVWNYELFQIIESKMSDKRHGMVNDFFDELKKDSIINLPGSQSAKFMYNSTAWECSSDSSKFGTGHSHSVKGIYPIPGGEAVPRYPRPIEQQMFETRIQMEIDAIKSFLRENKCCEEIDEASDLLNVPTEHVDSRLDSTGWV